MKTIEIFKGTGSFSKVAKELGHDTFTVDNNQSFKPDLLMNVRDFSKEEAPYKPDILWASPPCTAFSVASIGKHWGGGYRVYEPKTESARTAIELMQASFRLAHKLGAKWWFIENPVGVMRKLAPKGTSKYMRHTITYCQYGDKRMKPTDIWTNAFWWKPRPRCKNGAPCHVRAPRGSNTGTQGLKGAKERGVIPPDLFYEIFQQMPK